MEVRAGLAMLLAVMGGTACIAAEAPATSDPAAWRQVALERAHEEATEIADPYRRAEGLTGVARAQILIHDSAAASRTLQTALKASSEVAEPTFQGWTLHEIALVQLAANDFIGARDTTQRIRSDRPKDTALAALATAQLRAENFAAAKATAQTITNDDISGPVLRIIVAVDAASGNIAAARDQMRRIDDDYSRTQAAGDIAVAEIKAGNLAGASSTAGSAPREHRAQVYERMAVTLMDAGDVAAALALLGKIDDPIDRALVQGRIALRLADTPGELRSQALFDSAAEMLNGTRDKQGRKSRAWPQLARMQALGGDVEGARVSLARAEASLAQVTDDVRRDQVFDQIARTRIRIRDSDGAFTDAARITDRVTQALLIRDIVAAQAGSSDATPMLQRPQVRKDALTETAALFGVIGIQLLRKDEVRKAPEVVAANIELAEKSVSRIDDVSVRPAAFAALAAAQVTIGELAAGRDLFNEAVQSAAALERPEARAAAYIRIVNSLDERLLFLGQPANADPKT